MNIWQKRGMKSFCFFLLIILLIRKCGLLKKDEIIEDKEKNSVTLSKIDNVNIEDNTKKLNSDYLVTKKSQKNKKIVAVEEIIEDKQEVKVDIKETDIEEDIQEKNNKFIEPVIIEEMDILFEQGYKYVEENKADEVGKILASIDPITVKPKLNVIGDREFGKNTLSFYVYSNYLVYLDSGEIEIYGDSQGREKLATLILDEIKLKKKYEITLSDGYKNLKKVYYKLIVRDKNNKKDAKAPFLLIIFCMNFKVRLWMITYWTNIRCFFPNNDMSTVTTFPNLYFTFSENFLHFYIMQ